MSIYIIAEIGINHNGDLDIARQLIEGAAEAGCDAVKFQKRDIDQVYTPQFLDSPRDSPWGTTQREQKQGLEFGRADYEQIAGWCSDLGLDWSASAWDLNSQQFLREFDLKFNKVASALIVWKDYLEMVAEEGRYTYISTGMTQQSDIDTAVEIFRKAGCPFELMHCVSTYPLNPDAANLNRINTLRDTYQCKVGYSGHEVGLAVSIAAVAMGATSLERHITLDRAMYGSDQAASVELGGLRRLVGYARGIESAFGTGEINSQAPEFEVAKKLREHIPAAT